jgi:hypothetical protein
MKKGDLSRRRSSCNLFEEPPPQTLLTKSTCSTGDSSSAPPTTPVRIQDSGENEDFTAKTSDLNHEKAALDDSSSPIGLVCEAGQKECATQTQGIIISTPLRRRCLLEPPKFQCSPATTRTDLDSASVVNTMYWFLLRDCGLDPMFGLCDEEDEDQGPPPSDEAEHTSDEDFQIRQSREMDEENLGIQTSSSISSSISHHAITSTTGESKDTNEKEEPTPSSPTSLLDVYDFMNPIRGSVGGLVSEEQPSSLSFTRIIL